MCTWDIGNAPTGGLDITLSGGSDLSQSGDALRLRGSSLIVGSGSVIGGGFWDLNNATLTFDDGAGATMTTWEQKGTNIFNFNLGPAGFTALTPGVFQIPTSSVPPITIADATYNVDMLNYTGGTGTIVLADFTTDSANMNNALFQTAGGLNVTNAGAFTGSSLQWNDTTEAIELVVVPEPGTFALIGGFFALGVVVLRRRRG